MRIVFVLLWLIIPLAQSAETNLPVEVRSVLGLRQIPAETLSVYVADVESGDIVLDWRTSEARNPASTIKLLTTLVALDVLGPAYRWKTDVYVQGKMHGDLLDGDLILKGYGDPFLVTERVWQLLRNIQRAGVRDITGDLLLDDSWFRVGDYDPGAFDNQPLRAYNVAPNALLMNFKVVRYWFEPDHVADAVSVTVDPPLDNIIVENQLGLANGKCRGYRRGIAITTNKSIDEVTFSGRFPNGCRRYAMDRTVLSHNAFTYGLFRSLWRESGGLFDGEWRKVVVAEDSEPLLSFASQPLGEVIARVNKHSNNVMARHLLYTLSAEVNGPPGTEEGGRAAIYNWLRSKGLESDSTKLQNGAGLSRFTRISAKEMGGTVAVCMATAVHAGVSRIDGVVRARRHLEKALWQKRTGRQSASQNRLARRRNCDSRVLAGPFRTSVFDRCDAKSPRHSSWTRRRGTRGPAAMVVRAIGHSLASTV